MRTVWANTDGHFMSKDEVDAGMYCSGRMLVKANVSFCSYLMKWWETTDS